MNTTMHNRIECMLFVAGEPVTVLALSEVLGVSENEMRSMLYQMECSYRDEGRGIQLLATDDTVQLTSNRAYVDDVEQLLQPDQVKSVSQSILETLAIVAYRQPVTRADIEAVRGVRCEYAVTQLLKLGLIEMVGRKDTIGKPMLFGTTDKFLHRFGIHNLSELPDYLRHSIPDEQEESILM
ncbi:MAG: SMC-Scp complex subunit ScpB [Eubacteriales bacterium]|nr:SMC-Scp complex subunit ScpB [Eubacteriales bacterium]